MGFPPPGEPLHPTVPTNVAIRWLGPCSRNMEGVGPAPVRTAATLVLEHCRYVVLGRIPLREY